MASNSKKILIDGQKVTANLAYLGDELVWVKVKGKEHIIPRKFWDGAMRIYKEPLGGPQYGRIEGDEENTDLIQRIEYVLHSGYDATDRELLREALAALKEQA